MTKKMKVRAKGGNFERRINQQSKHRFIQEGTKDELPSGAPILKKPNRRHRAAYLQTIKEIKAHAAFKQLKRHWERLTGDEILDLMTKIKISVPRASTRKIADALGMREGALRSRIKATAKPEFVVQGAGAILASPSARIEVPSCAKGEDSKGQSSDLKNAKEVGREVVGAAISCCDPPGSTPSSGESLAVEAHEQRSGVHQQGVIPCKSEMEISSPGPGRPADFTPQQQNSINIYAGQLDDAVQKVPPFAKELFVLSQLRHIVIQQQQRLTGTGSSSGKLELDMALEVIRKSEPKGFLRMMTQSAELPKLGKVFELAKVPRNRRAVIDVAEIREAAASDLLDFILECCRKTCAAGHKGH